MRKFYLLGLAVFSVLAVTASMASSAMAVSQILYGNEAITNSLHILAEGKFLIEDMLATGTPDIECEGMFTGRMEPGGVLGYMEEMTMIGGELLEATVTDQLLLMLKAGDDLECTDKKNTCEGGAGAVLVVAMNLPWHLEVDLVLVNEKELYVLHFLNEEAEKEPAFWIDCPTLFGLVEDQCDGLTYALLENTAEQGLLIEFSENEAITPAGNCSIGGNGQGLVSMDEILVDAEAGATARLSVSE